MNVVPKPLFNSAYAANADTIIYTAPASTNVIIDKFTATNNDSSTHTLNVNIIPSGGSVGATNLVVDSLVCAVAGTPMDLSVLQNQILAAGDSISVKASTASNIVIRASGREVLLT